VRFQIPHLSLIDAFTFYALTKTGFEGVSLALIEGRDLWADRGGVGRFQNSLRSAWNDERCALTLDGDICKAGFSERRPCYHAPVPSPAQNRQPIDVTSLGPQVGEPVPNFALPDQHGTIRTLDSIRGERGAMIVLHRSADW